MGYSLRSRSASKSEIEIPKKAAVASKPAAKKAAPAKKTAEIKKVEKKTEIKKEEKKVADVKKVAGAKKAAEPKKPASKPAAKAKKAQVKADSAAKPSPAKKAAAKPTPVSSAKKSATVSKPVAKKAASPAKKAPVHKIAAPIVKIEEIDTPFLPEVEPILHEEPEEKVIEIVEGQVVNTHIRFSDDDDDAEDGENFETSKDVSIKSSDFEALDDIKEEPTPFELYNSESETEEIEQIDKSYKDEFDEDEEIRKESPVTNAHSAFEAFTSEEKPKTFNWNNSGSTYYKKPAEPVVAESIEAPTVISNPFGFGFTATAKPNPFNFNSHFQSVSSPLDKLCSLTSKSNPLPVTSSNFSSSMGTSSFLPTSPAAGFSKAVKSPIEQVEDKEERSPSVIQSIIIDDKHEDFSAF